MKEKGKKNKVGINASKSITIQRLHKLGFKSCVPKTKPLLLSKQMTASAKYCKQRLFQVQDYKGKAMKVFYMFHGKQSTCALRLKQETFDKTFISVNLTMN